MSEEEDAVRRALSPLSGEGPALVETPEETAARRARVVGRLQALNRDEPRRRTHLWVRTGAVLAAAAAVGAWIVSREPPSERSHEVSEKLAASREIPMVPLRLSVLKGAPSRFAGGKATALAPGLLSSVEEATRLQTSEGDEARIQGGRGLDIVVRPKSTLELLEREAVGGGTEIVLEQGTIDCSVEPRGTGPKLAVVTPDARVVVKGTAFSVEVVTEVGGGTRTCVRVSRGVVAVTKEGATLDVTAGQDFGCFAASPAVASAVFPSPALDERSPPAVVPSGRASTLAEQNASFARGLAAERALRYADAEEELVRLLRKYPETTLRSDVEKALARVRANRGKEP